MIASAGAGGGGGAEAAGGRAGRAVQQEARPAVVPSACVLCVRSKEPRPRSRVGGQSGGVGEVSSRRLEGPVGPSRAWQAGPGLSSRHAGPAVFVT